MGHQARRDLHEIFGDLLLGDARLGIHDAIGIGEARQIGLRRSPFCARSLRALLSSRLCARLLQLLRAILAHGEECALAHLSVAGPARHRDFDDEARFDPFDAPGRGFDVRDIVRRLGARQRFEPVEKIGLRRSVKARADAAGIMQLALDLARDDEGGERAPAVRRGPADDRHVLAAAVLHLHPIGVTSRPVGRVAALGHDAFGAAGDRLLEERRAAAHHVFGVDDRARAGALALAQQRLQPFLALDQRQLAQVLPVEMHEIEGGERDARVPALDRFDERGEIRDALVVEDHRFAVDHGALHAERFARLAQALEARGPVVALAGEELRAAIAHDQLQAIAVVLHLVQPLVAGGRGLAYFAQLRRNELRRSGAGAFLRRRGLGARRARLRRFLRGLRPGLLAGGDLLARQSRRNAGLVARRERVVVFGVFVAVLHEQPVLARLAIARLHAHERPLALHALAVQPHLQHALVDGLHRIGRHRVERALIPQLHCAAAVFALRDHALERGVVERMIFGAHRQPLGCGPRGGAFRDGPAFQHAVDLEPEIVMLAPRPVMLHAEPVTARRRVRARGLGRLREVALGAVLREHAGGRGSGHARAL